MKGKLLLALAFTIFSLGISGCGTQANTTQEEEEIKPIAVEVVSVKAGDIRNSFEYSGKLASLSEANIISMVSGKVDKVYVQVGDTVNIGDTLFTMDTSSIVLNKNSVLASVNAAEANILVANSNIAAAQLAFDNAKQNYDNNLILYQGGAISKASFDQIDMAYRQAQLNLEKADIGLTAAIAQRDAASSQLGTINKSLNDSVIKAPISGIVASISAREGELLGQAQGYHAVIMDMSKMLVKVSVSEQVINKINKGDNVDLKIKAVSESYITGTVKTVSPAASYSGTYDVEIEIDNSEGNIKAGMFAEVSFTNEMSENVLTLPKEAVLKDGDGSYIYKVEGGLANKTRVTTSIDDGANISILDGIKEGDNVIIKGQSFVTDKSPVNVIGGEE